MRVAVLGGGPAGAAAALALVRGGIDTTLFLPARQGEKPCGGALPGYLLDELPGFDAAPLPGVRCRAARLENAAGSELRLRLEGLRIYRRADFDDALRGAAAAAGARLAGGKARLLETGPGGVRVGLGRRGGEPFDWVIAADGARGLGRRTLGAAPREESVGLGATLSGTEPAALVLAFPEAADAYLWIFPRPGGASVGIAFTAGRLSDGAARALLGRFVARHGVASGGGWLRHAYRYPIPVFGPRTVAEVAAGVARRVLLAGDAAGIADPLTREGIRWAVRSGRWAAESLLAADPAGYPRRLEAELGAEMGRARRARRLFYEEPIGRWMVPVCRRHPGVRRVLEDLLACRQPYAGLRRRLATAALSFRTGSRGEPAPRTPDCASAP